MAFVRTHLDKPTNQQAEVLYELMQFYKAGCTRRTLMEMIWCMNAPEVIRKLRSQGVEILTEMVETTNKHGRPVRYGVYKLRDFKQGVEKYPEINK
jgi:hypothetical protein